MILEYKGYTSEVRYCCEDNVTHGRIEEIRDIVTWEATPKLGAKMAFMEAVDDYLMKGDDNEDT